MTMEPISYAQGPRAVTIEHDRRGWLIAFGVVNLLFGLLAGCMVAGMIAGFVMMLTLSGRAAGVPPMPPGLDWQQIVAGAVMYVAIAVFFVWAGIDSIRCRRWVRPVTIALGWMSLASSLIYLAFFIVGFKDLSQAAVGSTTVTTTTAGGTTVTTATTMPAGLSPAAMLGMTMVMMIVTGILIPAAYVWFYSRDSVRQTLEAYDPRPSWTERCPLPVFVACAGVVLTGFFVLISAVNAATPFFGAFVKGFAAVAVNILAAAVMVLAAALMYRLKGAGRWLAVVCVALAYVSVAVTLWAVGPVEFYGHGNAPPEELEQLRRSQVLTGKLPLVFICIAGAFCIGYLMWVGRYFVDANRRAALPDTQLPPP